MEILPSTDMSMYKVVTGRVIGFGQRLDRDGGAVLAIWAQSPSGCSASLNDQVEQVNLLVAFGIRPISYQAGRGLRDSLFCTSTPWEERAEDDQ